MAVLNKHHGKIPAGAVYIGRGSKWGNPFVIGTHGDRDAVCEQHRRHLMDQYESGDVTLQQLADLQGKDLVCYCAPARCHGDTLVKAAAWAVSELNKETK